jgi:hypothetical protein
MNFRADIIIISSYVVYVETEVVGVEIVNNTGIFYSVGLFILVGM